VLAFVLSLALVPLLQPLFAASAWLSGAAWWLLATAAVVAAAHAGLYHALSGWSGAPGSSATALQLGIAMASFGVLFAVQGVVRARPGGRLARRLYPWLFAGLFLDELFTRITFRLWPAPHRAADPLVSSLAGVRS
jgi:NAD(P)H-quinone oxidoreductase subunit 5